MGIQTDDPEVLKLDWKCQQRMTFVIWKRFIAVYLYVKSQITKWYDHVEPISVDVVKIVNVNVKHRN